MSLLVGLSLIDPFGLDEVGLDEGQMTMRRRIEPDEAFQRI
jgi:hypothetical protein